MAEGKGFFAKFGLFRRDNTNSPKELSISQIMATNPKELSQRDNMRRLIVVGQPDKLRGGIEDVMGNLPREARAPFEEAVRSNAVKANLVDKDWFHIVEPLFTEADGTMHSKVREEVLVDLGVSKRNR